MALYRLEWEQFLHVPLPSPDDDDFALFRRPAVQLKASEDPNLFRHSSNTVHLSKVQPDAAPIAAYDVFDSEALASHRQQHVSEIQMGNLKLIKKLLAESVSAMLRDEVSIVMHKVGDTSNGYGIRVFPDGTLYAGDFLRGSREGVGILRWGNGHSYYGQWLGDVAHGPGVYRFSNGDACAGVWDNGHLVGSASYAHGDGESFDGKCVNSKTVLSLNLTRSRTTPTATDSNTEHKLPTD
jgi:hypothetical protein